MGVGIDMEIWKHKEEPNLSTQGKGTPATSSSAPALTSELVGKSSETTRSSTTALATGMITISSKFLQSLIESQRATDAQLMVVEIKMTTSTSR